MGGVMLAVPGIERQDSFKRHDAQFGMAKFFCEVGFAHGAQQVDPPGVQIFEQRERNFDGRVAGVG